MVVVVDRTERIPFVLIPNLRSGAIRPCANGYDVIYSRNLCVGDLDILGVLRGRGLRVLDVRGQHLVFRRLRGGVVLL
jgi:hypothetical protein